jgi:hypothetical protein
MRGSEPGNGRVLSATRKKIRKLLRGDSSISAGAPVWSAGLFVESKSQLCSSRSRERQRPPDRHTRRRGRRYVERAFAFLRGASVSAVAAREVFLETTGGEGPRVSRPLRRANFFKICPRSSPALFSSISRARRCPSSASFSAGESRDDRHSDDRARRLLRRLLCPSRDRSPSLTFPSLSRDVFPSARVSLFAHARKPFVCPAFLLSTKIHGPT